MVLKARVLAFMLACIAPAAYAQTDSVQTANDGKNRESRESKLRKPRVWALSAEAGINSLSSVIGPVVSVYPTPRIALDLGAGLSLVLPVWPRPGIRGRYLFSKDKVSYFAGTGLKFGPGTVGETVNLGQAPDKDEDIGIKVDPSPYADLMLGVDYLSDQGLLVIANLGYSFLLSGKNISTTGPVSERDAEDFEAIFGSGPMLSVSLGRAF